MKIKILFYYNLLLFIRERQNLFLLVMLPILIYIILGESFRYLMPAAMNGEKVVVISDIEISKIIKSKLEQVISVSEYVHLEDINKKKITKEHFIARKIKGGSQVIEIRYLGNYISFILYSVKGYEYIFNALNYKLGIFVHDSESLNIHFTEKPLSIKIPNYALFLFPGIIIMSILNTCLFGIGTELAIFREKGILKRLLITPLRFEMFLTSYLLSRFLLIIVQVALIFVVNRFIFHSGIENLNILSLTAMLFLTTILATLLGFLIFIISDSSNSAVSFSNYISMPMLFFSGAFFPVDNSPVFSKISLFIPLTPIVNILRSTLIFNDSFHSYQSQFILLALWILIFGILCSLIWKFGKNRIL
jgi:ABC-type multidrug transport system permease subunit